MEIKLRYTWRRKSDGKIEQAVYTIEEIENDEPIYYNPDKWELVARDLWTGLKDSKGVEIYESDIVRCGESNDAETALIVFKEQAFLLCYLPKEKYDSDNIYEHMEDYEYFEILGNHHTHPELITKQGE